MNEIEMAIDAIETALEQEPILEQGYEFYAVIKESLITALSALREQAERSKGCVSCDGGFGDNTVEFKKLGYTTCPCCGKRLEVEP